VVSAPDPSCHKRACRGEVDGDSGRIEDDHDSPRSELVASEARAEESARLEAPTGAVSSPATTPEADSTSAREVTPAGAIAAPSPVAEGVVAGGDAAAHVSSDPPSQEGTHEVTVEVTEETPTRVGVVESLGPATRSSPSPRPVLTAQAVVPVTGAGASTAAGSLLFKLASNSGDASQGLLTTRVVGSGRGENLLAPEVGTQEASRGKAPATAAGSDVGSLSSVG
jgi:hypothetical protein